MGTKEMEELKPFLQPLKGEFGNHRSLCDCDYDHTKEGIPILKFSIIIANIGRGQLHIILGEPQKNGKEVIAPAKQRIYYDDNSYWEKDVGSFERHEEVMPTGGTMIHWHYPRLASIDLINDQEKILGSSEKEGYCLADSFRYQDSPNTPLKKRFDPWNCVHKTEVGLSIGWADHYDFTADEQYIKIRNVPSGLYRLRFSVNSTKLVAELGSCQFVQVSIDHENKKAKAIDKDCEDIPE